MEQEHLAAATRRVEALQAAVAGSLDSADQMEEDDDEEINDEIDPDDEEEELALRQPTVHDVHVGTEAAPAAAVSGRDALPNPARLVVGPVICPAHDMSCTSTCLWHSCLIRQTLLHA